MTEALVIDLVVPGDPKAKGRPRLSASNHTYTPKLTRVAEKSVRSAFEATHPGWEPLAGRLRIEVDFFRRTRHRVDTDNLLKLVKDALNGVAWVDDEQIDDERARRFYAAGDFARIALRVWTLS